MRISFVLAVALAVAGCKKDGGGDAAKQAPAPAPAVAADGTRVVPIEAGKDGYAPDKIPGKPGEKLKLVFTRTVDSECLSQVKVAGGTAVDLPMGKPVEIAVTVPSSGQLTFACGMDMFTGVIVADGKS
jgi:plastocyanin domain-containing protein